MRWIATAAVLAAMTSHARADVFEIKDLDAFEECMQLDELAVTVKTSEGSQTRLMGRIEIQVRCIASATQLLASAKRTDAIMPFVAATKRLSAPVNALPLIDLVVRLSLPACDDDEIYDVLVAALEIPGQLGYVARAKPIVVRCLKDKAFLKDFTDELGSHDKNLAAHACDILVEQKLIKSCRGSKP